MSVALVSSVLEENPVVGELRTGGRRYWTGREEKILRDNYPTGGLEACLPLLPGRTASSIYGHANVLGVRGPLASRPDFRRQRWTSSDALDAVIVRAWPTCTTRKAVFNLAKSIGRPRWWVSKRAVRLGLVAPRFKQPPWSAAELEIILNNAHRSTIWLKRKLKAAGFDRSETAILVRLKREGADREDPNHHSAHGLAKLMGVDSKTVGSWAMRGLLKAKRRGTDRVAAQGGDEWWIHRRDVRTFIIENAAVVDIRKVEKFWFIDLIAGVREDST